MQISSTFGTLSAGDAGASAGARPTWPVGALGALTALSLAALLIALAAAGLDARTLYGESVWAKPARFAASFALFFATLALVAARLSPRAQASRGLRAAVAVLAAAFLYEISYIHVQAARGVSSHFNFATLAAEIHFALMGIGAVALMVYVGAIGVLAGRDSDARLGPGLRRGVRLGFLWSAALTILAGVSIALMGGPLTGAPPPDAAALPLLGWSGAVGDLRPAHFLALHAMQAGPLLGLWADRRGWPVARVRQALLGYAALTLAVYAQALAGYPLLAL